MNKITIIVLTIAALLVGFLTFKAYNSSNVLGGISSSNYNYYGSATNTNIVCNGATSTLVLAATTQGRRRNFMASLLSTSTPITLCKSSTGCVIGNGIQMSVTSTVSVFDQTDGYYGGYSCIGNGASSTIGLIYSQN